MVAADKTRIRVENNVLISFANLRNTVVNYKFRYAHFIETFFNKNIDEFHNLKNSDQVRLTVETLNEVYMDQAVISTRLL